MTKEAHRKAKLLGLTLADGETLNGQKCPKCGGGIQHDTAFSITRERGKIKYICYRAKCGFRGILIDTGGTTEIITGSRKKARAYSGKTCSLQCDLALQGVDSAGFLMDIATKRLVLPIYSNLHREVGVLLKRIKGVSTFNGSKAIIYWSDDVELKHDFRYCTYTKDTVYLVEDQLSANCVHNVCDADVVALLGTHITNELILELKKRLYKNIIIALDEDAWNKASKYEAKWSSLGVTSIRWESGLDPKDMSIDELKKVFCGK